MVQGVGYNQVIWEQLKESFLDAWVLYVFKTQPEKHLLLRWGIMQALNMLPCKAQQLLSLASWHSGKIAKACGLGKKGVQECENRKEIAVSLISVNPATIKKSRTPHARRRDSHPQPCVCVRACLSLFIREWWVSLTLGTPW